MLDYTCAPAENFKFKPVSCGSTRYFEPANEVDDFMVTELRVRFNMHLFLDSRFIIIVIL